MEPKGVVKKIHAVWDKTSNSRLRIQIRNHLKRTVWRLAALKYEGPLESASVLLLSSCEAFCWPSVVSSWCWQGWLSHDWDLPLLEHSLELGRATTPPKAFHSLILLAEWASPLAGTGLALWRLFQVPRSTQCRWPLASRGGHLLLLIPVAMCQRCSGRQLEPISHRQSDSASRH